ncbi:MAG TPA: hypothetical protein VJO34_07185 [Methylomirabilota bacterium]|nr:hypothetical protein [Methylomirabilota bacterium]
MSEELNRDPRSNRAGLRFRRRDDHAVNLFREARNNLSDVTRVDRILLELGRLYDPVVGGTLVDLPLRQKIVGLLREGRFDEAGALLDARLAAYTKFDRSVD